MHKFKFTGGVANPEPRRNEKFLLFFVVGGNEIPLYQMVNDGLVQRTGYERDEFSTKHKIAKVFISQQGFGIQKRYHSFYIEFRDSTASPTVTVVPFSGPDTQFQFVGNFRFLKKDEILEVLDSESTSYKFAQIQQPLPVKTLNSLVTVDRSHVRKGVRHVRIGRKTQKVGI